MQPIVKPLARWRRNVVFGLLLTAFLISLPAFIFYATGYQYDFSADAPVLTATGGFYISAEAEDAEIYINDVFVDNARTFRNASYVQRLEPGRHTLHVQAPGLQTWVKELMVYPGIVTEVEAFNVPEVSQVRIVSEYELADGTAVVPASLASSSVLQASTSPFFVATTSATSTYRVNPEYILLKELFLEQASSSREENNNGLLASNPFGFSTTTEVEEAESTTATTTKTRGPLELVLREADVYAILRTTNDRLIPNYFCSEQSLVEEIEKEEARLPDEVPPTQSFIPATVPVLDGVSCRTEIKIDRKGMPVVDFEFYPPSSNLVLLQRTDGLYVVEIDDRVWQNSQLLYPGSDFFMLVYREGIYVLQDGIIFEVLPVILPVE